MLSFLASGDARCRWPCAGGGGGERVGTDWFSRGSARFRLESPRWFWASSSNRQECRQIRQSPDHPVRAFPFLGQFTRTFSACARRWDRGSQSAGCNLQALSRRSDPMRLRLAPQCCRKHRLAGMRDSRSVSPSPMIVSACRSIASQTARFRSSLLLIARPEFSTHRTPRVSGQSAQRAMIAAAPGVARLLRFWIGGQSEMSDFDQC